MSDISSALIAGLTKGAQHFVTKMNERISQNRLPKEISDSVVIETAQVDSAGNGSIRIKITDPSAAAYEYGSGIHRTKGNPNTYTIKPKNGSILAFDWPGHTPNFPHGKKYIGYSEWFGGPKFLFLYVDHPGVAARPYIAPTITNELPKISEIISKQIVASITFVEKSK